jgi:hypothetical protein
MAISGQTGGRLAGLIKRAIGDGKLTNSGDEQIPAMTESDGTIDR